MAQTTQKSVVDLVINGERAKVSMAQLGAALKEVRKEFRELKEADDPKLYKEKEEALQKLNQEYRETKKRINEVQQESKGLNSIWKEVFKGMSAFTVVEKGLQLIGRGIDAVKQKVISLSDELADVAKTTNLSSKEVDQLNTSLQKLDTRTKMEDLRGIAEIGGRWNVAAKDLESFVRSTDRLNVAFGDQFDSVEALTDQTLKLRNIFRDIKSDDVGDDILHIGNAMNVLEASGAATGKGLADFSSRIGGVAIPLGLTTSQVLGLSASLEELSVSPERGATAVNRILQKMLTDVEKFAKIAGMRTSDFRTLLNTDLFGAFLKVAEGSQKSGESATAFAEVLKDTKLQGAGASEVLMKLASNQELVNEKVVLASEALTNTNSVMEEFNKKNNNAAAIWEKILKRIDIGIERVARWGIALVEFFGRWSGMIDPVDTQLEKLNAEQEKLSQYNKLTPLLDRYEKLRIKTKRSSEEQTELNSLIQKITEIMPEAAIAFNKHGEAIDVDAERTRELIKEQKILIETLKQSRKELLANRITRKELEASDILKQLNAGTVTERVHIGMGQYVDQTRKLTAEEIRERQRQLAILQSEINQDNTDLWALNGGTGTKGAPSRSNLLGQGKTTNPIITTNEGDEGEEDTVGKAKNLAEQLKKIQQDLATSQLEGAEKEIQIAKDKYDTLRELAKGNAKTIAQINELEKQEISTINHKYAEKNIESFDKQMRTMLQSQMKIGLEKTKMEQEIAFKSDEAHQAEIEKINIRYTEMLTKAQQLGVDTVGIYTLWSAELHNLKQAQVAKDVEVIAKGYEEERKAMAKSLEDSRTSFQIKLAEAQANGESETALLRERLEKINKIMAENATLDLEQTRKLAQEKRQIQKSLLDAMIKDNQMMGKMLTDTGEIITNVMKIAARNQKESSEFEKSMALFNIAVQTGVAISNSIATAMKHGKNPVMAIATMLSMIATVTANMAKAKSIIEGADTPATPAFREEGGWTDISSINRSKNPSGWVNSPTLFELGERSYIAGEKWKREYVISNEMLQNPAISATAQQLEHYRVTGQQPQGGSGELANLAPLLMEMIAEQRMTRKSLEEGRIGVRFNYKEFNEGKRYLDYIYSETSL